MALSNWNNSKWNNLFIRRLITKEWARWRGAATDSTLPKCSQWEVVMSLRSKGMGGGNKSQKSEGNLDIGQPTRGDLIGTRRINTFPLRSPTRAPHWRDLTGSQRVCVTYWHRSTASQGKGQGREKWWVTPGGKGEISRTNNMSAVIIALIEKPLL